MSVAPYFYLEAFPNIIVTDIFSARSFSERGVEGVGAILNVSEFPMRLDPVGVEYRHIELFDGPGCPAGAFIRAVETLNDFQEAGLKTIVHCHAGISRSASVAAVHMMRHRRSELLELWNGRSGGVLDMQFLSYHRFLEDEELAREEGFPVELLRDPVFKLLATAFKCLAHIRPCVYLRPSMWAEMFPKIRPYLAGEVI